MAQDGSASAFQDEVRGARALLWLEEEEGGGEQWESGWGEMGQLFCLLSPTSWGPGPSFQPHHIPLPPGAPPKWWGQPHECPLRSPDVPAGGDTKPTPVLKQALGWKTKSTP